MNKKSILLMFFVAVSCAVCSCGLPTASQRRMQSDISDLQTKVATIESGYDPKLKNVDELIKKVSDSLKNVEDNYKSSIETSLKNQASNSSDIEAVRSEFRQVKGDVEEIAHKIEVNLSESKNKINNYDEGLRKLELDLAQLKGKLEALENNQKLFTTLLSAKGGQDVAKPPAAAGVPEGGVITPPIQPSSIQGAQPPVTPPATTGGVTETAKPAPQTSEDELAMKGIATEVKGAPSETQPQPDAVKAADNTKPEGAAADSNVITPQIQSEYDKAMEVFKGENFDEAKKLFSDFVKKYPNTTLTDNAQFWYAECFYEKKELDKAILEYDKMITTYPNSDKISSALLKEGFSFLELNYKDDAVTVFNKLIKNYPASNQAEIARRKLKVIK